MPDETKIRELASPPQHRRHVLRALFPHRPRVTGACPLSLGIIGCGVLGKVESVEFRVVIKLRV